MASLQDDHLSSEQVSVFLGKNYVLTFQEREGDSFEPVRKRIREGRPLLMSSGPDYLTYALMDAIVDGYFPVLERYGERMEDLESAVLTTPTQEHLAGIYDIKHDILALRRSLTPMRELLNALTREPADLIRRETTVFLRDCYDHALRLLDMSETYRELAFDLVNLYLSNVSNRMNQIMKVLTIIATIFIPLGFLAGLYGMNFNPEISPWNMPELNWRFGYPFALAVMGLVALLLLFFFKRKGWFD
jgi:magnesium transporter